MKNQVSLIQKPSISRVQWALILVLLAVACVLPFSMSGYLVLGFTIFFVYAIIVLGLNLLYGYAGQISLGQVAFFAIGSYMTAILMARVGMSFWIALLLGGLLSAGVGAIISIPSMRLRGFPLAIVTFALVVVVQRLLRELDSLTGGLWGVDVPRELITGFNLTSDADFYYMALAFLILFTIITWSIAHSKFGRALRGMRDSEIAATSVGVRLLRHKTAAFSISAFYAGIAGGIYAVAISHIGPTSFTVWLSLYFLVAVFFGGVASIPGSIIGAAFIALIPRVSSFGEGIQPLVFGGALVLVLLILPGGLADGFQRLAQLIRRKESRQLG